MITRVVLPKFTKNMTQAVIRTWKVEEGQGVVPGDVLAEIETDTAVMELEAAGSGFLRHILINEGSAIKTGTVLAVIGDLDDDIEPALKESIKLQKMAKIDPKAPRVSTSSKNKNQPQKEALASSRKARTVTSSESSSPLTPKEPVMREAVEEVRSSSQASPKRGIDQKRQNVVREEPVPVLEEALEVVEDILDDTRVSVEELEDGLTETPTPESEITPHFNLTTEISMVDSERLRAQMMDIQQTTLSFTTLYVRAAALAFSRLPEFEAACLGYEKGSIDIGIAITVEDRLLTPIIRNCGQKNIAELSDEIDETTQQTRTTQWISDEDADAFFSIANLGMYPIERFTPILRSTQAASLAIGAIRDAKITRDAIVTVDRLSTVSLCCNDECLDEDQAAKFLGTFKQILERPLEIFLPNPVE